MRLLELLHAKINADQSTGPGAAPWSYYKEKLKLISLDATCINVPNSDENDKIFGRSGTRHGAPASFPQAHIIGWLECGARRVLDLQVRPRQRGEGLAGLRLIKRHAREGQLIMWDRGFPNRRQLCLEARSRGAHFLIRLKKNLGQKVEEILPDGTYLTYLTSPKKSGGNKEQPVLMRIIEYTVGGGGGVGGGGELIRVGTSLLDWRENPAADLAATYRERWEIETVFDEIKTHQLGRPNGHWVAIRAQWAGGVIQEIYGMALAHGAIHGLMMAAAMGQNVDADRISFKNSLVILRRHLPDLTKAETIHEVIPLFTKS
jgi:hypothetical protein